MSSASRSNETLRVVLIADPEVPVPPRLYGGIERVIHFLAEGLHARGHEVVLFAHRDSRVSCRLIPFTGTRAAAATDVAINAASIAKHVYTAGADVIHSFGRLAGLAPLAPTSIPKLMSYQRPITARSVRAAIRLFGASLQFTACGRHMIAGLQDLAPWHVIPNGVPLNAYAFRSTVAADAPLVFLGRVEEIKGPHLAIAAAAASGRRLVIAGNVPSEHQSFFEAQIKPHVDNDRVQYIGPVDDRQKNQLLGDAAALLMPILWDEPFGIVMAEALACGTPVIGLNRGAVPEVVTDGVTGFFTADPEGLAPAIARVNTLSRHACREAAETRFSDRAIVSAYEALYRAAQPATAKSAAAAAHVGHV